MSEARFGSVVFPGALPEITEFDRQDDGSLSVRWMNGVPPYVVESTSDVSTGHWYPVAPVTPNFSSVIGAFEPAQMIRVRSAGVAPDGGAGGVDRRSQTFGNKGGLWLVSGSGKTRIEAENFDEGGPDVAYRDADSINQGGSYRSEDVDIGPTTDVGGGFYVGAILAGEWLEYTVNVATAGTYQLRFRAARSPAGSSTLRVLVNGVDKTGNVTLPRTGGAQTFTTVTKTGVAPEVGLQRMRIEMVVGDFNLNWIEIAPWRPPPPWAPRISWSCRVCAIDWARSSSPAGCCTRVTR